MNTRIVKNLVIASIVATSSCAHAQTTNSYGQVKADLTRVLDTLSTEQVQELEALLEKRLAAIAKPSVDGVAYSESSLDSSLQKLSPNFAGHDPQQIYAALVQKFGPKTEFETTQQYQERLRSEKEKPLFSDLTVNGLFASTIDHTNDNSTGKAEMVYDADRQVLQITAWLSPVRTDALSFLNRNTKQATRVKTVKDFKGTYVGENAYGTKRDILKVDQNLYHLIFNNPRDFGIKQDDFQTKVKFEVPMNPDTAKDAKSNLRILLLYRLAEPFTQEKKDFIFPKIDNPREGDYNDRYLNAKVEEIWFYNTVTGEIYRKIKPGAK